MDDATSQQGSEAEAAARRARFGALPEPVRVEDMVEERAASAPDPARTDYNQDEWLVRYCL
ncbi:hypothetical protein [Streptomyces violaceus]|uniref:Cation-transporting P-type ATPase N-terminal domain-containing protein n=1 Tax=Streptomyces violaceus TaxID=1936 RepID=A0ABY9UKQ5_STRVL|nr:hypothetical protein [Streptomyces janthinus]WND23428.1 hypothetical protein RI060_41545 [Streptomyces janthinus]GGS92120.1 hypothetical protein GCM10010270_75390 [Streptomyces janthinus]